MSDLEVLIWHAVIILEIICVTGYFSTFVNNPFHVMHCAYKMKSWNECKKITAFDWVGYVMIPVLLGIALMHCNQLQIWEPWRRPEVSFYLSVSFWGCLIVLAALFNRKIKNTENGSR